MGVNTVQFADEWWAILIRQYRPRVVYDVGAYHGHFCRVALEMGCRVVAFEPNPRYWDALAGLGVQLAPYALGPADGTAVLRIPHEDGMATLGVPYKPLGPYREEPCRVRALDQVRGLPWPDLIKLDAEGAELGILQGAEALLLAMHPVVLCEHAELRTQQFGYQPEAITMFMSDLGYEWVDLPPWDRCYAAL